MNRNLSGGVDINLASLGKADTPHCPHGSTVLFERYTQTSQEPECFYACTASRDRKFCKFFQRVDEKRKSNSSKILQKHEVSHGQYYRRLRDFRSLSEDKRNLCSDCGLLLLPNDGTKHDGHKLVPGVTEQLLNTPTKLLMPLENSKTNAQYLFSETTVAFILDTIKKNGFKKILCVGTPRIHEEIQSRGDLELQSLLLDIDHRYYQFYNRSNFLRYNMFNHHLFDGEKARQTLYSFLLQDKGDVLILTDPPFGGLAELMAYSLDQLNTTWKQANSIDNKDVPVMWFFPYFLESKVTSAVEGFSMLDYQVEYENHASFRKSSEGATGGSKHGSVVRIFTNVKASNVPLPKDGYRYCKKCQRHVYKQNKHCSQCNACTSKDGRTYVHCSKCSRCVKPNKVHCGKCAVCHLPGQCGAAKSAGCHVCGSMDHRRRNCPSRDSQSAGQVKINDGQSNGTCGQMDGQKKGNDGNRKRKNESSNNVNSGSNHGKNKKKRKNKPKK